jgi:hypothetical protein
MSAENDAIVRSIYDGWESGETPPALGSISARETDVRGTESR